MAASAVPVCAEQEVQIQPEEEQTGKAGPEEDADERSSSEEAENEDERSSVEGPESEDEDEVSRGESIISRIYIISCLTMILP